VLCGFLISLSGKIMSDVDEWKEQPRVEEFQDGELLAAKLLEIEKIQGDIKGKYEKQQSIESTIAVAQANYQNAKESFDNWLAARETVGSPNEDSEVLSRANDLDTYYQTEQEWRDELLAVEREIEALNIEVDRLNEVINNEKYRAYQEQEKAIRKYDVKVFLIRLLIVLPILALGILFIIKFRKHKYWPLFLGFVLFSFYAFFFGLVPYLPSYGGYIRYTVGIILVALLGIYAINRIRAFMERKKTELKESTAKRAKNVQMETAEKALDAHMCPSCGKDFILRKWDRSSQSKEKMVIGTYGMVTNFCRYCGLELFKACANCETQNFAHLPYCANCGDPVTRTAENAQ